MCDTDSLISLNDTRDCVFFFIWSHNLFWMLALLCWIVFCYALSVYQFYPRGPHYNILLQALLWILNLFWLKFWWLQFLFLCCLICCRFFSHSKSASRRWNCTVCCFGSMFNVHVIHVYKIAYPLQASAYLANSVYVWCVSDIGCDTSTSEKRNALSCVTTCVPSTQYNVIHFIDASGWNTQ